MQILAIALGCYAAITVLVVYGSTFFGPDTRPGRAADH